MTNTKIEVHLSERDAAQYFSNAAALYVLGLGFSLFAHRAPAPFTAGLCFWFSMFLLCDCLRQWRVSQRLENSQNLCFTADEEGITHFVSWLQPEHLSWQEIQGLQVVKGLQSETLLFQSRRPSHNVLRYVFFGMPKYDLPLSSVKEGKAAFFRALGEFPGAHHLVPDSLPMEQPMRKAA